MFIYALNDPETGKCRYIGATLQPKKRFQKHFWAKEKCPRTDWIKDLVARGLRPILEVLDKVSDSEWPFWEREYIRVFRAFGLDLTNVHPGGYLLPGEENRSIFGACNVGSKNPHFDHKHTPETKAVMRSLKLGKKASLETRAKQSEERLGRKNKNNTSGFVGVCWFPETKKWHARISTKPKAIHLGYYKNLEDAVFVRALAVDKYFPTPPPNPVNITNN